MGGDGGLRLGEDGVGVGLIGGGMGWRRGLVARGLGWLGLVTLRSVEATLTMSFRPELREMSFRDRDESE